MSESEWDALDQIPDTLPMVDELSDPIAVPRVMERLRNALIVFNVLILMVILWELAPWLH